MINESLDQCYAAKLESFSSLCLKHLIVVVVVVVAEIEIPGT